MNRNERRLLELLDRRSLDEHAKPGTTLLVAVSGGADSVALLRALLVYAPARDLHIEVVHVNHGLRAESQQEEQFVRNLCDEFNVPVHCDALKMGDKPSGKSPEEFWRDERYECFLQVFQDSGASLLALGQTADDLAETFLYHLTRGTGPAGLQFHFYKRALNGALPVIRPLWKTRRSAIEAALVAVGQQWMNDLSNLNLQYSRNRIRQEVLPALEKINPAVVEAIVSFADKLAEQKPMPDLLSAATLELDSLRSLDFAAVTSELNTYLKNLDISHATRHVEQAADMVRAGSSGVVALPNQQSLVVTQSEIWIFEGADPAEEALAAEHMRRFGGIYGSLNAEDGPEVHLPALDGCSYQLGVETEEPTVFRNRKPGDRVGPRTLKKLMIDYKIPWYLRDYIIVAATEDGQVLDVLVEEAKVRKWIRKHSVAEAEITCSKVDMTP